MKKIAAFFDIDGTIYREGLITEVFKKIIKYELVSEDRWYKDVRPSYIKWDKRQGDYDDYLSKMVDVYIEAIKGVNKSYVEYIAKRVIEQNGDRVYTFTRDRLKWHKEQGHLVIAISGSPVELVKEMSEKYNMDDYRGTIYQLDFLNNYNGEVIPMWDHESKLKALTELASKYNIDLENSYAYGDTSGDFTMFKSVGNPYAINPTRELIDKVMESEEVKEKINVIVERKDVVYSIDLDTVKII
ncbi:HAD-IB family hydrolase [Clostridium isatidis]|uniref:phosphoserine phosphatase n=1 Tax=Clostridium isatidis TaxID=182773 RepID=A0A343JB06_9CLOT|nr:HAD-IB family hydrolase [Clostridium isatidis]ASW42714.1 haloacid dehalogenase [Clostridium isatidis]NLZ34407.1 HAD-IB family hydrolase [Clostridiales bacterium]